jgi:DNA-binding HxlR family transcriptional regulator
MQPPPGFETFAVVGDRWTLRIVTEIFFGRRRFDSLVANTGVPRNTLANRLRTLEEAGVVSRCRYSERPPRFEYRLTEAGEELIPALLLLLFWGIRHIGSAPGPYDSRRGLPRPQRIPTTASRPTDSPGACGVGA